jgi:hypothetical protein
MGDCATTEVLAGTKLAHSRGSERAGPCYDDAMPKRPRRPRDPNELAFQVFQEAIGERPREDPDTGKNPAAVALGKLGGTKGGKARAAKLTPEERRDSARLAAMARWGRAQKGKKSK